MNRIARLFELESRRRCCLQAEAERSLQVHRTRHVDPTPGQWLSEEPAGNDSGDTNLHPYVGAPSPDKA